MTNKRQSISREETKLYLDHACEAQGGRKAVDLAEILNVPQSRISDGRSGSWSMTESHKQVIIEKFGAPRGCPGTYVQAETHASLDAFLANEAQSARHRHLVQIAQIVNSPSFKQDLAKAVEWSDEPVTKIEGQCRPDNAETRVEKLERLEALMALPKFEQWLQGSSHLLHRLCAEYQDKPQEVAGRMGWATLSFNIDRLHEFPTGVQSCDLPLDNSLEELAKEFGIRLSGSIVFPALFVLGQLRYATDALEAATGLASIPPYGPTTGLAIPAPSIIEEYVITGNCIFDAEDSFSTPKVGEACLDTIALSLWPGQPQRSFALTLDPLDRHISDTPKRSLSVDYWVTYRVAVYLKDNCDYALYLALSDIDDSGTFVTSSNPYQPLGRERNIIIPDIPAIELFKVLEDWRKWLGMPEFPLLNLKSQIAQKGGYIPGARVI